MRVESPNVPDVALLIRATHEFFMAEGGCGLPLSYKQVTRSAAR
jgi:hypothetical protein